MRGEEAEKEVRTLRFPKPEMGTMEEDLGENALHLGDTKESKGLSLSFTNRTLIKSRNCSGRGLNLKSKFNIYTWFTHATHN